MLQAGPLFMRRASQWLAIRGLWFWSMAALTLRAGEAPVSFETQIQPLLEQRCFECHSHASGKAKGGLVLDSKAGWQTGGDSGPALVPGDVAHSRLLRAVRREEEDLQMPPKEKLSDGEVKLLEAWVQQGAPDPRTSVAGDTPKKKGIDFEKARRAWPFAPLKTPSLPSASAAQGEVLNPIDLFIQQRLAAEHLRPSSRASARTLIRRAYYDLIGLPPSYEEAEAFAHDDSPEAFTRLVEHLLARPEYGPRWARHWLDVARYADTTEQSVDGERRIPFAHTYRDYVIEAFNADKPFDRFVLEQIAADRLADATKEDLRALGFLTVGRRFSSNIEAANLVIDDRIDVIGRGFLGLTLACARCHDHKFDPIPTADYYSLFGILGSVQEPLYGPELRRGPRTPAIEEYERERLKLLEEWQSHVDRCFTRANEHFRKMATEYLRYVVRSSTQHRTTEGAIPLDTPTGLLFNQAPARWEAFLEQTRASGEPFFQVWHALMALKKEEFSTRAPEVLKAQLEQPKAHPWVREAFARHAPANMLQVADLYGQLIQRALQEDSTEARAITNLIYGPYSPLPPASREDIVEDMPRFITEHCFLSRQDGEYGMKLLTSLSILDATAPIERPMAVAVSTRPLDPHVLIRGEMKHPGAEVPRKFLTVLSGIDARSYADDGRLQLAQAIVNPKNPLTARVIVNRVWQQHFGIGLVATPDNLGVMGEKPSHPELLDWLAQWFMNHGWSLKALHRLILNSATWQQESGREPPSSVTGLTEGETGRGGADGAPPLTADPRIVDPSNRLLWRMTPRRLEFEPMRDALLEVSGQLDERFGGRSKKLSDGNHRRAVYLFTDRFRIPALLRNFDVANPDTSISRRSESVVPLQALFLFNSPFVRQQAEALLRRPEIAQSRTTQERIRASFRAVLSRDPAGEEVVMSEAYLTRAPREVADQLPWTSFLQGLLLSDEFVFVD